MAKKIEVARKLQGLRPFRVYYEVTVVVERTIWSRDFESAQARVEAGYGPEEEITAEEVAALFDTRNTEIRVGEITGYEKK